MTTKVTIKCSTHKDYSIDVHKEELQSNQDYVAIGALTNLKDGEEVELYIWDNQKIVVTEKLG